MNSVLKFSRVACFVVAFAFRATAGLKTADVFTDNMILQRGVAVPVWGTAASDEEISVSFAGQEKRTKAGGDGKWVIQLDALDASGESRTLTVTAGGKSAVPFTNVVVGEVWLATGQSNMRFMLKQATGGAGEIEKCADRELRLLNFTGALKDGVNAASYFTTRGWRACDPQSAPDFSAVAYFFAKKLRQETGVPVGVILNAVGGAPIESFLPARLFAGDEELRARTKDWLGNETYPQWCRERAKQELSKFRKTNFHPFAPSAIHDAGIAALQPFAIAGVIWYQGESNATGTPETPALDPAPYAKMFSLLVADWRAAWNSPALPVVFAQLPGLNRDWVSFREMQSQLPRLIPNCAMVVTIDAGHATDVHPPDKKPVGDRLALAALKTAYSRDIEASGPLVEMVRPLAPVLQVIFKSTGGGLVSKTGEAVTGFQIAGADKKFFPATGRIIGETVRLSSDAVKVPVFARYAWEPNPVASLFGKNGLPAAPFRTDE